MRKALLISSLMLAAVFIAAAATETKNGTLRLKQEGITLELILKDGSHKLVTSKPMTLKAGNYDIQALRLLKKDDKGKQWEMRLSTDLTKSSINNIMLDEGQDKIIDDMEPLVQHITTWQEPTPVGERKSILLRYEFHGRHSENYFPAAWQNNTQPPLPGYKIKDTEGNVLMSGQVSGTPPAYQWRWQPPAGFAGKFTVEVDPVLGPFTVTKSGGQGDVK